MADETGRSSGPLRLRAWLELLRVPNLFTVPGDPIAGFLLAGAGLGVAIVPLNVLPGALAALFLYMAGLVTNDLFDLSEDRRDRPDRPLPSGRVRAGAARAAAVVLFLLGIASASVAGLTSGIVAGIVIALVLAYNSGLKRMGMLGPLVMGLCRGGSLLLGAAAFGPAALTTPAVVVAAVGLTVYILYVTLIASKETTGEAPGWVALAPCLAVLFWLPPVGLFLSKSGANPTLIVQVMAVATAVLIGMRGIDVRLETQTGKIAQAIGSFIRALLPIQACLAMYVPHPGIGFAVALLAAWPVSALVGRRFYAS